MFYYFSQQKEQFIRNKRRTDEEWLSLIQECRWLMVGLSIDQPKVQPQRHFNDLFNQFQILLSHTYEYSLQ